VGRISQCFAGSALAVFALVSPATAQTPVPYPAPYPAPYGGAIPNAPPLEFEVGLRYWYSTGKSQKSLFDLSGALLVSRLTWTSTTGHTGEGYFNITDAGVFVKGYLGVGFVSGGNLQDEDFPPVIAPYSSTNSQQKDGRLNYASADLGYYLLDGPRGKLGGFIGYHFYGEKLNAFGCTQTATNPGICVPSIPTSVRAITENDHWYSARVGVAGEVMIMPGLKLSGDAAYLPYVKMTGSDTHWLRPDFSGPIPEKAHGTGMQFEGVLTYYFNDNVSLGVGGRYWKMDAPHGQADFTNIVIGGGPQAIKFETNRYGTFVQLGLKY